MNSRADYARRRVRELRHQGFDKTTLVKEDEFFVACSYCFILWDHNGKAQHYENCPNQRYLCQECNEPMKAEDVGSHCGSCVLELL